MHKRQDPLTVPKCYERGAGKLLREHLRTSREAFGMTQRDFATELGISVSAYAKYEQGYIEPSFWTAHRMCEYIDRRYRQRERDELLYKILKRFTELPEEKKDEVLLKLCESVVTEGED